MRSPVGSWLARVEKPSGTAEVGLHFTAAGLAFLVGGGHGVGGWEQQGDGIAYRIREALIGDDGDYLGYIDISQRGAVTADRLDSSGQSQVYGPDGTLMRTVSVHISATPKSAPDHR